MTSVFTQSVIAISERAFSSLMEEYQFYVDQFMLEYPGLTVDFYVKKNMKNDKKSKVYVKVSSENR